VATRPAHGPRRRRTRGLGDATARRAGVGAFWENVAQLPASFLAGYAFAATTFSDSSNAGNPYTAFFVQAVTANPFVFYNSSPDSGYSVDNLPPHGPPGLTVLYEPTANELRWNAPSAPDLRGYELYRGATAEFEPTSATLVATLAETCYTDVRGGCFYKLAAVDIHGNHSRYVSAAPNEPNGTLASFVRADRTAGQARLSWYSGGNAGIRARVQRRQAAADWTTLATIAADGGGTLRFDDHLVEDALRYAYRLAVLDDADSTETTLTAESWVDPLAAARLALALGTNPSVDGRIRFALMLAPGAQAEVSLFDLAGREVERRAVDAGGDGHVDVTLGGTNRLEPGVYVIRAVSGSFRATRRVAVLR
jgi:hypothetical protein